MLNKERHRKEIARVGKPSESLRFKNTLVQKMNNSSYDAIRNIIETNNQAVEQPQMVKPITKENKSLNPHKKYSNNKNKRYR